MAEITLIREGVSDLLPMVNRSAGLHVSHIIHYLCVRLGHYKANDSDPDTVRWELGNALEHAIIARYELSDHTRYLRPGEFELDGLYGTPDLLDLIDRAVEEVKLTWKSANHDIHSQKFWRYFVQLKAYCHMLGWTTGRLHVCFVDGGYEKGMKKSIYRVWECRFTKKELEQNWAMLLKNGKQYEEEQARKEGMTSEHGSTD